MNIEQYQKLAARTLPRLSSHEQDVTHMVYGMLTEIGELADAYKKHMAYGKHLDKVNILEELGDIMWYWAGLCTIEGLDPSEVLMTNIYKLAKRYPEKFDESNAINRNLEAEREILENGYGSKNNDIQETSN